LHSFVDHIEVVEDVVYVGMSSVVNEEDIIHVTVVSYPGSVAPTDLIPELKD
jgi:hypothetical protein